MERYFEKISFEQFKKDIKDDKELYDSYLLPRRSTKASAGYDFLAIESFEIKPGEVKKIPTGIKAIYPDDETLMLFVRSSMGFKWNVRMCNQVGIIDADFYNNPDNDPRGPWTPDNLTVKTYSANNDYPITTPGGRVVNPAHGSCWRVSKSRFEELVADNRVYFGDEGNNVPRLKRFLNELQDGMTPTTIWKYTEVGHSQDATKELKVIFNGNFKSYIIWYY